MEEMKMLPGQSGTLVKQKKGGRRIGAAETNIKIEKWPRLQQKS